MTKLYRYITFATLLTAAATAKAADPAFMSPYDPWTIEAAAPTPEVEFYASEDISIKTAGRRVHISGAEGETLEVYNIAGVKIATFSIDAPEKTITLTVPRGVYILHVGNVARRINICA